MAAIAATWAISLVLMVMGSFTMGGNADPSQRSWFSWGIYVGLVAQVWTGWSLVAWYARRERLRLEHLAQIMAHERGRLDDSEGGSVVSLH